MPPQATNIVYIYIHIRRLVWSEADRLSSQEMLAKLQDLHPQPNPAMESLLSVDMQRELAQFQASPENNVSIDTRRLLSLKIFRNKLIKGEGVCES